MKPPQFDYEAPETVEAAVELLAGSADAKVLAGGQSLLPILSLRLTHPEVLIDLRRIEGLGEISRSNGSVRVGTMATWTGPLRNTSGGCGASARSAEPAGLSPTRGLIQAQLSVGRITHQPLEIDANQLTVALDRLTVNKDGVDV